MSLTSPASRTFRGEDTDKSSIFRLHFEWEAGMKTSLHKHRGWELVLVRSGELNSVVGGTRNTTRAGEFVELPTGSVRAIWSSVPTKFDVLGYTAEGEADDLKPASMTLVPS